MSYNFLRSAVLLFAAVNSITAAPTQDFASNAKNGLVALQQWYNPNTGIWDTTGWWNSANCLTVLGDLAAVDSSVKSTATSVFAKTFVAAPKTNSGIVLSKTVTENFNIQSLFTMDTSNVSAQDAGSKGFLNGYYDDEGWWALAWIQAYDVTGNQDYLNTAVTIFNDMKAGTEPRCGGGIWWDKKNTYVNAIANELYLSVAAHLANRIAGQKAVYVATATSQWNWFLSSGMLNSKSLINDGLTTDCKNNGGTVWSYNQGVILGALVELSKANFNPSYLKTASSIATAAIAALSDASGVLHDPCEPNCGGDGTQFKGIFMRNLQMLQKAAPNNNFLAFMATNAASVWSKSRNGKDQFGVNWAGPAPGTGDASMQSSAMDALVAAAAFQGNLQRGIASVGSWWEVLLSRT